MNRRALLMNTANLSLGSALLPGQGFFSAGDSRKPGGFSADPRARGAKGDGKTNDRVAIQASIDDCYAAGGGIVYLAPGTYLTGTVVLKSNVTLYLEAGATLLGSTKIEDYIPQPGPDADADAGQRHLIFARGADNITICGRGVIDGQGPSFWVPSHRRKPTDDQLWKDAVTFDWKFLPRPSPMVELVECTNVCVEGITLQNSPGWTLHPIECRSVFIKGIRIRNPIYGINVDGIDLTCSQDVFISDCDIQTADDAICLKSEAPYGRLSMTRNIMVTNCVLSGCCNGLKIGTSTKGGFENITFSNSVICSNDVPFNQRIIAGVALEMVDGGWIEGVTITGIRMQRARTPIFIRRGNRTPHPDGSAGRVRGIMISDVHATGSIATSSIIGLPSFPVEDVTLSNIRIDSDEQGQEAWAEHHIPEDASLYPEANMFGRLPAAGLYCRHVSGLQLKNMSFQLAVTEARPVIACEDASQTDIAGLRSTSIASKQPVILLKACKNVWVRDAVAPERTETFLEVRGEETSNILLSHSNMRDAENPVATVDGASAIAVAKSLNVLRSSSGE